MAILKIARMGHPVLGRIADAVPDPQAPEIAALVADMMETMGDASGTGLAAPQVHVPLRIIVFYVSTVRATGEPDDGPVPLTVLINPEWEPLGEEKVPGWEGCLSLPGLTGEVQRYTRIRYRGTTLSGEMVERTAGGFHARVVQHECDHLDGILYPQRMGDLSRFGFIEEVGRALAAAPPSAGEQPGQDENPE
jgi:peptide deformylase